tara:strand:+ start:272 stop:742 length:471 start_codon:yes stop_codon:yes gene_type:complete
MNRKELTETVLRALRPVKEEEEVEFKEKEVVRVGEPEPEIDGGAFEDVQNLLVQALQAAEATGDEKLVTQIGNTITFVTRSQVKGAEAAVDESETPSKYSALAEKVIAKIRESQKKTKLAEDWDDCIDSVMDQGKSQKDAEKICGAINRDYVGNYR